MKKLKLDIELLRVQSFDTGGPGLMELRENQSRACQTEVSPAGTNCFHEGTVRGLAASDDCASKKADTMCEPPPSGQQACFAGSYNSCQATQPVGHCC